METKDINRIVELGKTKKSQQFLAYLLSVYNNDKDIVIDLNTYNTITGETLESVLDTLKALFAVVIEVENTETNTILPYNLFSHIGVNADNTIELELSPALLNLIDATTDTAQLRRNDFKEWYTLDQVADKLGITKRTLYNYVKTGQLEAKKVCQVWRVSQEALNDFVEHGTEINYTRKLGYIRPEKRN